MLETDTSVSFLAAKGEATWSICKSNNSQKLNYTLTEMLALQCQQLKNVYTFVFPMSGSRLSESVLTNDVLNQYLDIPTK